MLPIIPFSGAIGAENYSSCTHYTRVNTFRVDPYRALIWIEAADVYQLHRLVGRRIRSVRSYSFTRP
jgi:hypothetical protein